MKKLIILFGFLGFALFVYTQDRTVGDNPQILRADILRSNSITYKYDGVAADTLTSNQDTIHFPILINKSWKYDYYVNVVFDTISGADTTVVINMKGKMFSSESYTLIETTTSSAVSTDYVATAVESMTDADFTNTVSIASTVDTLINGTNTYDIDADLTQIAYVDTSTLDSLITEWTVTPSLDTSYITRAAQTVTFTETPSIKPCYRYLLIELIISGDDATGTGILLDEIEIFIQRIF